MAKVKLKEKIKQLDGKPVKWRVPGSPIIPGIEELEKMSKVELIEIITSAKEKEVDLKMVCTTALLGSYGDERIDGYEKSERGGLAQEIYNAIQEIDLSSEQITLLKMVIGKAFGPLVVSKAYEILDPVKDK